MRGVVLSLGVTLAMLLAYVGAASAVEISGTEISRSLPTPYNSNR